MKLLLVAPICNGEDVGEAWVAFQWARILAERHDVTLLTSHKVGAKPAGEQLTGLRVIEWREPPLLGRAERFNSFVQPGYIAFYLQSRRWVRMALARGERFNVAHQTVPVAMRYPSPVAGLGIPFVLGPVGGGLSTPPGFVNDEVRSAPWFMVLRNLDKYRRRFDPLLRHTYKSADCVLGIAEYVGELLADIPLRRFEIMSETGLDRIPPMIDRNGRDGPVRLLFVGRLVRTKGVRDAIRAMSLVRDLAVALDIVGDGPERAECGRLVDELGLADRVTLHGWKPKEEIGDYYRAADIFVFPSYREPGGNVTLEAMSFSLPAIVVDRGGPGSAVSEACALKLSVTTPDALTSDVANAIRKLVEDADMRRRMGAAAHEHVSRTALWTAKVDRMSAIYDEISWTSGNTSPVATLEGMNSFRSR